MLQALASGEHDASCNLPDLVSYVLRDYTAAIPAASADLVRKVVPDGGAAFRKIGETVPRGADIVDGEEKCEIQPFAKSLHLDGIQASGGQGQQEMEEEEGCF
jgi:hypothetical protein